MEIQKEISVLNKVQNLSTDLIRIIYSFCNGKVKLIFNPKWNWYLKNVHFKFTDFNIKFKVLLNNLSHQETIYFHEYTLKKNVNISNYLVSIGINEWNVYRNKKFFYEGIMEFISIQVYSFNNLKKKWLSSRNVTMNNTNTCNNEYSSIENYIFNIENIIFLCKSILYVYSIKMKE